MAAVSFSEMLATTYEFTTRHYPGERLPLIISSVYKRNVRLGSVENKRDIPGEKITWSKRIH